LVFLEPRSLERAQRQTRDYRECGPQRRIRAPNRSAFRIKILHWEYLLLELAIAEGMTKDWRRIYRGFKYDKKTKSQRQLDLTTYRSWQKQISHKPPRFHATDQNHQEHGRKRKLPRSRELATQRSSAKQAIINKGIECRDSKGEQIQSVFTHHNNDPRLPYPHGFMSSHQIESKRKQKVAHKKIDNNHLINQRAEVEYSPVSRATSQTASFLRSSAILLNRPPDLIVHATLDAFSRSNVSEDAESSPPECKRWDPICASYCAIARNTSAPSALLGVLSLWVLARARPFFRIRVLSSSPDIRLGWWRVSCRYLTGTDGVLTRYQWRSAWVQSETHRGRLSYPEETAPCGIQKYFSTHLGFWKFFYT
jgi:hypothetical protein